MKKIILNCDWTFLSFIKKDDSTYKYSNFSDILYNEKAWIKFKVSHSENIYYNLLLLMMNVLISRINNLLILKLYLMIQLKYIW